jgi:hypothetical protein
MAIGDDSGFEVQTLTALTAVGVTDSAVLAGTNVTFQVTVASIGTSVVIRMEGSLDDTNYFSLYDSTQADTTITANGTYGFCLYSPIKFARLRLVTVTGGTPTIATKIGAA